MRLLVALVLAAAAPAKAPEPSRQGECLPCHARRTPGVVKAWENSAHAKRKVGCEQCHGKDHARIDAGTARADLAVCGRCHPAAAKAHAASRHGVGLKSGWGCTRNQPGADRGGCAFCHDSSSQVPFSTVHCARFLKQSEEMREVGCNRCHRIERACDACHTSHATDLAIVRAPAVCARCHMGPDHPQWEAWETSQHGALAQSAGPDTGPTCQRCHMPYLSHDVSAGITNSPGSAPLPESGLNRERMILRCADCHAEGFARRELLRADAIRDQSRALVKEAREIVEDLYDRGVLEPMPAERPPHPLSGEKLETGAQMLYEDLSHAERLLFEIMKYDLATTVKGAYHQSPDYAHWYGNAELKLDLSDLRAEARRLREKAGGKPASVEERLRLLKAKADRGALSPEEYARRKAAILGETATPPPRK